LELTGERTMPGIWHENYWFQRHLAAYLAALSLTRGRRVLEAGCGEGYGASLIRDDGAEVVAIDLDADATRHVMHEYEVPSVRGNLVQLPFADASFDTVVSMQTVEHLWDQPAFVAQCARVLVPHGLLVLTTPNRLTFSPNWVPGTPPVNPFHAREVDARELLELTAGRFDVVQLLTVRHGPRIEAYEQEHGDVVAAQLATDPSEWSAPLVQLVSGLDASDFVVDVDAVDSGLDLMLIAQRIAA
jgi:SAM-dependent methyltransferase